jgi:two-component sensor histidine kinase
MTAPLDSTVYIEEEGLRAYQAEAEHRIANSLQMISSLVRKKARADHLVDPQKFLLEIAAQIETVGKLHRLLAASTRGTVQLAEYLQEVGQHLTDGLACGAMSFSIECPNDRSMPARTALPLALVTIELVSNSLKYAHPAGLPVKIRLSCTPNAKGGLTIVYTDDGVGFPEGFNVAEARHMGMRLISTLCKGLGANPKWESDALGIRFAMTLPKDS